MAEPADVHFRQGMDHVRSRDFDSAASAFRRAVEVNPDHSVAHKNLGSALAALGRHKDAIEAYRRAIELEPDFAQAHFNLGASLKALNARDEAFACFLRTIEIDPGHEEAYYYLGLEHRAAGRLNPALACFLRASDLSPNEAEIYTAMGSVLLPLGLQDAAIQAFERAVVLNPEDSLAWAHLLHLLGRNCDWERMAPHMDLIPTLGVTGDYVPPFSLLALEDQPQRHRTRAEKFAAASFSAIRPLPPVEPPGARPEKLRIGYFSSDFGDHAVMCLAARMFELHDRDRFTIHAFSYGPGRSGARRERAVQAFDRFHEVGDLRDWDGAALVREEGIDIAVDLNGYTEYHRLGIFARRPAPVQMSFLGYPGTLGTSFIDYLIVDGVIIPGNQREAYSERLIHLPHSYQVTDNSRAVPARDKSRADVGLPTDGFVFCCFNNSYKLSPAEFGIWMDLLKRVDGSVLWLLETRGHMESNLRAHCVKLGVDPNRLIFAPRVDNEAHLARMPFADLFLDTFAYNAHTTTSDALWAGVPVVTKIGEGFAARVAASLLRAVGLDELVTDNDRDYAGLALALASEPAKLAALRTQLVTARSTAPLFDTEMFTRHIEQGYELAYQRYLDRQEPADIAVPA